MSRRLRPVASALVLWLWAGAPLAAQAAQAPPLFLAAQGDSVRVLITEPPPAFGGFVVYRRLQGPGSTFELLTPQPVGRVQQPAVAAGLIGADLPAVRDALNTTNDGELLRRLQGDRFAGHVLSLLYPQVAVVLGRNFVDRGLQRGATYEYRVVFTDNRGSETDREFSGAVQMVDRVPLAPGAPQATPGSGVMTVSWPYRAFTGDPADLVIGFRVYRADASTGIATLLTERLVVRNDLAPHEFEDTLVSNGVAYRYQVRAVDLARRESAPSPPVDAIAIDRVRPRIPRDLTAASGDGVVELSWMPSDEPDVSGYHLERSTGLDQPYVRLTAALVPADQPAYSDRSVVGGTPYFYRVVAVDASGNASRPSSAIAALPFDDQPPAPPGAVTARAVERRLEIQWVRSPSADVRGYYVYRGDSVDRMVRLVQQPVADTLFVDVGYGASGLAPGGRYTLRVSAVDRSYNESASVSVEIVVPDDEAPGVPTAFSVRNVLGRYAEAGWSPSPSLDVALYELSRSAADQPEQVIGQVGTGTGTLADTTAVPGEAYQYRLVAVDSAGNRSPAAVDTLFFRDPTPPPAPRRADVVSSAEGVQVSWERVVDDALAGYHVYRALVPTGVFERLTDAPVLELSFLDPSGRAEHYYEVRAVDRSGNESRPSPVAGGGGR